MVHTCSNCGHVEEVKPARQKKKVDPVVHESVKYYFWKFKDLYKKPAGSRFPACVTIAEGLLQHISPEEFKHNVDEFLSYKDDFFIEAGYPFGLLPKFISQQAVKSKSKPKWDGLL